MNAHRFVAMLFCLCVCAARLHAQAPPPDTFPTVSQTKVSSKWFERINFRGYSQFRYNRLLETNPDLKCEQCDRSIGRGQGLSFRRARLVLSGDIHPRVFLYLQFDYSADASSTNKHFLQVRDAYIDYAFDRKKEWRVRVGQSKVPYGYENLQSSSLRLPFDRSDAINSAAPNERDMGVFFMFAPAKKRALLKWLTDERLKGSGDYGVATFGISNGQSANRPELNDKVHVLARLSYPFWVGKQVLEPGIQAYSGKWVIGNEQVSSGTARNSDANYTDRRVAASFILNPQPFGIAAEYNVGEGPAFDASTDSIRVKKLKGGYVLMSYRKKWKNHLITIPYTRYQTYDGGKKMELDARYYQVKELEVGVEWQISKSLELTTAYVISHRKYTDNQKDYDEKGNFLRLQVQVNY